MQLGKKFIAPIANLCSLHSIFLVASFTTLFMSICPMDRTFYLQGTTNFQALQLAAIAMFFIVSFVVKKWFEKRLVIIRNQTQLSQKLHLYRLASITKFIVHAISLCTTGIGYMFTTHWSFLLLYIVQAFIYFSQRPHPILASAHLNEEQETLYTNSK